MKAKNFNFPSLAIRDALCEIEDTSQESLNPPSKNTLYMPIGHIKALHLSASVVVGMRGSGKSYWTAVLASDSHRTHIARTARIPDLELAEVCVGFALDPSSNSFPQATELNNIRSSGLDAKSVWYTVILNHALQMLKQPFPVKGAWLKKVQWFSANEQSAMDLLAECDREIARSGRHLLVLFDALDRLASNWEEIRQYLKALLSIGLESRSRRGIKIKVFLRPDMEEDEAIWDFVDSSKLRASMVVLSWRPVDLFGLVILNLANSVTVGEEFRDEITRVLDIEWKEDSSAFLLPRLLANGEQPARSIIEAFAGAWVGTSHKRGYVYTWIPTHLADAKGRLSPRSFLLAFRTAAQWTADHEPSHSIALHFKGIQQGVSSASEIRVSEIAEDYPWVEPLLEAARGITVPCAVDDLTAAWTRKLYGQVRSAKKLPPRRFNTDPIRKGKAEALIQDLVELAIIYRTEDNRINIPDIFRVGFGIRRLGGVRPPR
ncbi:hypothetical protein [Massilia sp. UBA6681]|uniref:hypothetical protein n=1 Tax=Massilia sp. UBA6681 TaxID=1946839 RepID=UPI0025BE5FE5|nr:hypothetical protein [Massilia sp. UBA6681]